MALFSRFRRNKTDQTGMPTEVRDYYKAEGRERTGLAWLLALATLLVTVLVVLGLFLGGRWAFRKLKDNNKPAPVAVQNENKDEAEKPKDEPQNNPSTSQPVPATPAPSPTGSTSTPAPQTQTPANGSIPNTGPGDNVAIFVAVSVLGYLAHRRFLTN